MPNFKQTAGYVGPTLADGASLAEVFDGVRGAAPRLAFYRGTKSRKMIAEFPSHVSGDPKIPEFLKTEAALIRGSEDGAYDHTLQLSTQFGCIYECAFCPSAKNKLLAQIPAEYEAFMVDRLIKEAKIPDDATIRIACVGEGDPGANAKHMIQLIRRLPELHPGIGHIRLSTAGALAGIQQLTEAARQRLFPDDVIVELQVSFHHTDDERRRVLIPKPGIKLDRFAEAAAEFVREYNDHYVDSLLMARFVK